MSVCVKSVFYTDKLYAPITLLSTTLNCLESPKASPQSASSIYDTSNGGKSSSSSRPFFIVINVQHVLDHSASASHKLCCHLQIERRSEIRYVGKKPDQTHRRLDGLVCFNMSVMKICVGLTPMVFLEINKQPPRRPCSQVLPSSK